MQHSCPSFPLSYNTDQQGRYSSVPSNPMCGPCRSFSTNAAHLLLLPSLVQADRKGKLQLHCKQSHGWCGLLCQTSACRAEWQSHSTSEQMAVDKEQQLLLTVLCSPYMCAPPPDVVVAEIELKPKSGQIFYNWRT
ncbi:uncharacterized protein LOC120659569 isoform X2 [Panicum virgatum]|uniref:uncharacterized protein LOC120659569 isoform X2 n=1 Tax=Panicum virgatum TaxID=38727 RepID=UPI0019D52025|nr:uncharacterized protein LOC120659569 isoform X2 [Panicum virgatum]